MESAETLAKEALKSIDEGHSNLVMVLGNRIVELEIELKKRTKLSLFSSSEDMADYMVGRRKKLGLYAKEVAKATGMCRSKLSRFENGIGVTPEKVEALERYYSKLEKEQSK